MRELREHQILQKFLGRSYTRILTFTVFIRTIQDLLHMCQHKTLVNALIALQSTYA